MAEILQGNWKMGKPCLAALFAGGMSASGANPPFGNRTMACRLNSLTNFSWMRTQTPSPDNVALGPTPAALAKRTAAVQAAGSRGIPPRLVPGTGTVPEPAGETPSLLCRLHQLVAKLHPGRVFGESGDLQEAGSVVRRLEGNGLRQFAATKIFKIVLRHVRVGREQ